MDVFEAIDLVLVSRSNAVNLAFLQQEAGCSLSQHPKTVWSPKWSPTQAHKQATPDTDWHDQVKIAKQLSTR
jgi:hypothetical protein